MSKKMSIKEFVDNVLCVPVTRIGNRYIVEAIELVLDTKEHKFYRRLSEILECDSKYLEKAMRDAKDLSLCYMESNLRQEVFGKQDVPTSEYVLKAAEYYRRTYVNEEQG